MSESTKKITLNDPSLPKDEKRDKPAPKTKPGGLTTSLPKKEG